MATRIALQRELCRHLYADSHSPIDGTNTSSTGTTITDTTGHLNYSSGDVNAFDRKFVYVVQAADAGARGESRVTEGGWTVTGSLTVDPSIGSLASGDLYIISDDPPAILQLNINRVLRNMYLPSFYPLSLHVMGNDANDMEPSTVATDYIAENSGTLATESTIVFNGAQSLKATAGAANSGASTGNISVFESKPYYTAVMCSVKQGDDADFKVVNVQDSDAQIDDNATSDEPSWTELVILFTPPSGCEQVDIFMLGTANGDIAYWDDFQIWQSGTGVYALPSWITRPAQMLDVRAFPQGTGGPASDNDYRANERLSRPLRWGFEREDRRATNELYIWVEAGSERPYIYALRSLSELSSDTSTTPADQDSVVFWAEKLMREPERAAHNLALVRSLSFTRPTKPVPRRIGVSM